MLYENLYIKVENGILYNYSHTYYYYNNKGEQNNEKSCAT